MCDSDGSSCRAEVLIDSHSPMMPRETSFIRGQNRPCSSKAGRRRAVKSHVCLHRRKLKQSADVSCCLKLQLPIIFIFDKIIDHLLQMSENGEKYRSVFVKMTSSDIQFIQSTNAAETKGKYIMSL